MFIEIIFLIDIGKMSLKNNSNQQFRKINLINIDQNNCDQNLVKKNNIDRKEKSLSDVF